MKRDKWIRQRQLAFKNPGEASILLEELKQVAGKHNVLIQNPVIGSSETRPTHKAVFAGIEIKAPLPPGRNIRFYDSQQLDAFVVLTMNLAIGSNDSIRG
jgi:hypothetical protein